METIKQFKLTKRFILLLLLFVTVKHGFSQVKYAIYFTDKNNTPFTINKPQEFLSAKAINRRKKQHITIKTNDFPVNNNYKNSITNLGAKFLYSSKWLNLIVVEINDTSILNTIRNYYYVSQIKKIKESNSALKNHQKQNKFQQEMASKYDYGLADDQIKIMNGNFLHNAGFKGENMTIAILDAGFNNVNIINLFANLWRENRVLGYWDFVNNNDSVFNKHWHGTNVLSTMAADSSGGMVGTSPKANFWLLRTENANSETISEEYNWLAGAEFADSVGADIINSSLGYTTFDDSTQNHTYADMDGATTVITQAANLAASKGILVVNSAGNSGASPWLYIGAPADAKDIMSIGAVNHDGSYASFSSIGPTYDGRIKPNVVAIGRNSAVVNADGSIGSNNGTSFSSPIIAGMSACLWQAFPNKTNFQIRNAIQQSASQYNNPDNYLGYGIPDFKKAYYLLSDYTINDKSTDQLLNIYPQPFNNNFNVIFYSASNQDVTIKITTIEGRLIYQANWSIFEGVFNKINISSFFKASSSVYFLRIESTTKKIVKRMVKQ